MFRSDIHEQLRAANNMVEVFDDQLRKSAEEMLLVMYAANGIGLAAPQVGLNIRLMVFNERGEKPKGTKHQTEHILVNPIITALSNKTSLGEEGCLSFPMVYGLVERSDWVQVSYQNLSGDKQSKKFEGDSAVIFQHEYYHLDKILLVDRLIPKDKLINKKRLEKMVKRFGPSAAP